MKSFDPIDILFMTLIGFYLIILIIFIIIFVILIKKYDAKGNRIKNESDLMQEMNSYSNSFLSWLDKTINAVRSYIHEMIKKRKTSNEVIPTSKKIDVPEKKANTTIKKKPKIKNNVKKSIQTQKKKKSAKTTKSDSKKKPTKK